MTPSYSKKGIFMLSLLPCLTFDLQNLESAKLQRGERCYTSKPARASAPTWWKYKWKRCLKKELGRKREGAQAKPWGVSSF